MPSARILIAIAATCTLSACGGSGSGSTASVVAGGASSNWALDACKSFPVAAAAKASGLAIEQATLGAQTSADGTNVSSCSYSTAGDREHFGVLMRQDTTGGTTMAQQIDSLKSSPDLSGPSEDVAMPKGKAVWQPQLRSLSYVPDDNRLVVVTPPFIGLSVKGTDPAKLKEAAIRIAIAAAG